MTSKRINLVLLAAIGLLFIGLLAGAYGINSLLSSQAVKLTNLKAKNLALSQQHQSLAKAKKEIATYSDLEKITHSVVPEDKNQTVAVREIVNIADTNDINLTSITFPASSLGGTVVGGATSSGATSTPPAASAKTTALSQLLPVKNIAGVYQLLISVQSDANKPVPYSKFIDFLSDLEHNRHTAQVSNIVIQPDSTNRNNLTFSLSLNEYIKP